MEEQSREPSSQSQEVGNVPPIIVHLQALHTMLPWRTRETPQQDSPAALHSRRDSDVYIDVLFMPQLPQAERESKRALRAA